MPWEKSFDIDTAVDRATEVFWAKGYEATSLADLLQAIGINKGSFYNAFGSKKALFTKSLLKYEQEQRRDYLRQLEQLEDPVLAIHTLFNDMIKQSQADLDKKGCFLVNTALDLPNHDDETGNSVKKGLQDTESFFERQIKLGIKKGTIPKHINPAQNAKGLFTLLVGLRVLARGVYDKNSLNAIKAQALGLIQ